MISGQRGPQWVDITIWFGRRLRVTCHPWPISLFRASWAHFSSTRRPSLRWGKAGGWNRGLQTMSISIYAKSSLWWLKKHLHDTGMEMLQAARESFRVLYLVGAVSHLLGFWPFNPRKSSGSILVPHVVGPEMNDQLTQQAAVRAWEDACSKSLQRWTRNMIHAPSMVFSWGSGFPSRFCRIGFVSFLSWAKPPIYHNTGSQADH